MGRVFEFPYRTVAEVSLSALIRNLVTLRACCRKEIIPVVKADAYGHGMVPLSRVLLSRGSCQMLAVATLPEAIELRRHFNRPFGILVLSGFLPHQLDAYIYHNLTPVIHSLNHLKSLQGKQYLPELHLKIDTGMHRLGITSEQMQEAIEVLQKLPVKLSGFATHFAQSEEVESPFSESQLEKFVYWYKQLSSLRLLHTDARTHVGNSGAILSGKLGMTTSVRPGLALYGVSPNPRLSGSGDLLPILQWKTRVLTLKPIHSGDSVGYNRTYTAPREETLAVLPVGYADGFPRILSNRGFVLHNGKRLKIRGAVSMDLISVDCTGVEDIREGSLVTLIGKDGKDQLGVSDLASWANTIPYELLCGISDRVSRIYFDSEAT